VITVNPARRSIALLGSCHPAPCVAVTVFAGVLAATAGATVGTSLLVAAAVLAGQLSIGWSNDRLDARRDASVGRTDKPLARGAVPTAVTDAAIVVSVLATIGLSLALGWAPGLLHLAAVACGWAYNVGVKATWWSWLPYALAFGALPAIATLALPDARAPGWWAITAAACVGVAAHLANVLPDIDDDLRTGVRGLPHRLGARWSLTTAALLVVAASALITIASPDGRRAFDWTALAVIALVVGAALPVQLRHPASKSSFIAIMGLAAVDIALLATNSGQLR
jgi:4-hydroxybenzoate polyprenyltransferase